MSVCIQLWYILLYERAMSVDENRRKNLIHQCIHRYEVLEDSLTLISSLYTYENGLFKNVSSLAILCSTLTVSNVLMQVRLFKLFDSSIEKEMSGESVQDQTMKKLVGKELDKAIREVVEDDNVSRLRELLETYDDVTERDISYGRKALHVARHVAVAKLLIQNGADVNAVDEAHRTSLHCATLEGHVDVAKLLIQNGADVNAVNKGNWTSLHFTTWKGHVDVVKLLIQNGADVNSVDKDKRTSLHVAARYGHVDVAKLLIHNGADVNAVDKWKQSVLYFASCDAISVPLIFELLCFGAKIDRTALEKDKTGLLIQIEKSLEKLRNGDQRITNLCSNEENRFLWNLAFCLTLRTKVSAFKVYYKIRSFITFRGIFMASGFDIAQGITWR